MRDRPTRRQALRRRIADRKLVVLLAFVLAAMALTKTITSGFFDSADETAAATETDPL